jgi:hypothetical protein
MFLLWGLLMASIGFMVGWLLCRVKTRSRRRRTGTSAPQPGEGTAE